MPGLSGLLLNPALEQILLYNVVGSLVGAALGPYLVALTNEVNQASPLVPLTPADLADAVIRNILDEGTAAREAGFAGINTDRFHTLTLLAGNAPDPESLAVALRRQLIDAATYDRGIRQGRLRDEWANLVRELAVVQPAPETMLAAYLEGQIPEGEARARFAQLGGDPGYFDILFDTQGQAPTPVEALAMANRGIIGWTGSGPTSTSFEQAFLEGPWRNKWLGPFRALAAYLPPPRTVTAMHREGSLSDAEAAKLLEQHGLSATLAQAYLASSTAQKLAAPKKLAESTVLDLYRDRLIPRASALGMVEALGYSTPEAEFVLEVEDLRVTQRAVTAAVTRIHGLFTGHKIDQAQAATALADLGIASTESAELLSVWDHERAANVRTLTPAQVASALGDKIIDQPTAQALLEADGYSPHDAWVVLSVHAKAPLPDEPGGSALPAPAGP